MTDAFDRLGDDELRSLLQRMIAGETTAAKILYEGLTPVIHWEVAKMVRKWAAGTAAGRDIRQEVADLVQETWVALCEKDFRALRDWRPEIRPLKAWVGYVGRIRAAQFLRSPRSQLRELPVEDGTWPEPATSMTPERIVLGENLLLRLHLCLVARSTPSDVELFWRVYVHGEDIDAVARRLVLSPGAVYKRKSRLKRRAERCRDQVMG